ncbi:MAG TPA: prepilin-type N-terminal cleavage/methylation domain-containing protein [Abditibacteriaceae bacterium]
MTTSHHSKPGFSLVEVSAIMAILLLLALILVPNLW